MSAYHRLKNEYNDFYAKEIVGAERELVNGNYFDWIITIYGPPDTPFENGKFKLSVKCSEEYPNKKPDVKFITPIFHPNVNINELNICYSYFDNWSSTEKNLNELAIQMYEFLKRPNPSSPLNYDASCLYFDPNDPDHIQYKKTMEDYVKTYAQYAHKSEYKFFVRGAHIIGVKELKVSSEITQKQLLDKLKYLIGVPLSYDISVSVKGETLSKNDDNKIISALTTKDRGFGNIISLFSNGTIIIITKVLIRREKI